MIKHEYKVLKPFTVHKDSEGNSSFEKYKDERQGGSSFSTSNWYVDYEFPHRKISLCSITQRLVNKGYISLTKTVMRGIDRKQVL